MSVSLEGKRVIMLLGPRYQDAEAEEPLEFLREKGARIDVAGIDKGALKGMKGRAEIEVGFTLDEIEPGDYDVMVIPGGRSPASLRKVPRAVDIVRDFNDTGRPIAAICHGPQMLAAAGLLEGRKITGYPKIRDEMLKAGADFVDEPVVKDGNLITSRVPEDIPLFNAGIEEALDG